MSVTFEPRLPFDGTAESETTGRRDREGRVEVVRPLADAPARKHATNPAENVVLEASAGTGKTRVLVARYVNLLLAGVNPDNILAITFTRKAAAEMRQRIIQRLRETYASSAVDAARWRDLRDRLGEISVSTIDAFCLSLIREFPLEADVDPGFELADETEIPRLVDEALDSALRVGRHVAQSDADVAMVFVQLGERRLRAGLASLLDRRAVAREVLAAVLESAPRDLTTAVACRRAADRLRDLLTSVPGGVTRFLEGGPLGHPQFAMLAVDLARLCEPGERSFETRAEAAAFRGLVDRIRGYFLTQDGRPRKAKGFGQAEFKKDHCRSEAAWREHRDAVEAIAPSLLEAVKAFRRDLNVILSRGVWRMFQIAIVHYVRTLESHALLDFAEVLTRAINLLRQMEEFSRSRYKLEARYRHVLVDEFQDTSRAQWELMSLLVRSWGEGLGASTDALPPSIFIVGDRKQSIYGFRDADIALVDAAADFIETLRPEGQPRQAISVSFRARPALLAFVNDLFREIATGGVAETGADGDAADVETRRASRRDAFRYDDRDRFPIDDFDAAAPSAEEGAAEFLASESVDSAADRVADEIVALLTSGAAVRDRQTGVVRQAKPGDIAILFRSRDSHRAYEDALDRRGVPTYVYKGLGFFDADEVQDLMALMRFLADPTSDMRAAAFMRSRVVRLSDAAVATLAPHLARALTDAESPAVTSRLDEEDRCALTQVREAVARWLTCVDRVTPTELLTMLLRETAYAFEMRGPRREQARENVKKLLALVRRIQNRGYVTLARLADHLEQLALGDEANAVIDAHDAINLMTVHAAKGLEFPIVFVVNLGRGTGGPRAPIRVVTDARGAPSVAIGDFESEADEDAPAREREESKRLLYVALTRARDRLYLSGVVKDGIFKRGRGSLGEVLPISIVTRLERSVCQNVESTSRTFSVTVPDVPRVDRFAPVVESSVVRHAPGDQGSKLESSKLESTTTLSRRLQADSRGSALLAAGRAYYAIPFSVKHDDGAVVRDSIDCLVKNGTCVTVVDLKMAADQPARRARLDLHLDVARALFPGHVVHGLLVPADDA